MRIPYVESVSNFKNRRQDSTFGVPKEEQDGDEEEWICTVVSKCSRDDYDMVPSPTDGLAQGQLRCLSTGGVSSLQHVLLEDRHGRVWIATGRHDASAQIVTIDDETMCWQSNGESR